MKIISLSIVCISLLLCTCKSESKHATHDHSKHEHSSHEHSNHEHSEDKHSQHQHGDHNKSNKHMNSMSFEDLSNAFEDKEREKWQKPALVIEKLGDIKGKKIGDIGAGTGYFSFRLAALGAEVTAIDVDERFQNFIKEKIVKEKTNNLKTKLVGYESPELADNEFDVLIIVDTYHHFNNKVEYMKHCFKGLKDDGMLMNVDFKHKETAHGPPIDHRITAEDVKKDLLEVGFKKIEIDQTTLPEQYIIIARK